MTRSFLPLMLRGGDKHIVNLSSIGANMVWPGMSGYQTGKMAILRFSEFTNAEYGEQGVVAFSVHPGGIMTNLGSSMPKEMHHSENLQRRFEALRLMKHLQYLPTHPSLLAIRSFI